MKAMSFSCNFFKFIIRPTGESLFFPSCRCLLTYMYIVGYHGWYWLVCEWRPAAAGGGCCGHSWRSLLGEFRRLFLDFQIVYERQDSTFHAGGHPAGHRVRRGWGRGARPLGGRPCHQTLLVPQLRKRSTWGFSSDHLSLIKNNMQDVFYPQFRVHLWKE